MTMLLKGDVDDDDGRRRWTVNDKSGSWLRWLGEGSMNSGEDDVDYDDEDDDVDNDYADYDTADDAE